MSDLEILPAPAGTEPAAPAAEGEGKPRLSAAKLALREARLRGVHRAAGLVPRPRGGDLPLSFAQERFWILERLRPGLALFNVAGRERLAGDIDPATLERALGEIVRRHETLRTVIDDADGVPLQRILSPSPFSLPFEDLSGLEPEEQRARVRARAAEESVHPFDLRTGPLFRARLLRLGEGESVLLYSIHHIVSDGWSIGVLIGELRVLYEAFREGRPSPLPELPVQYADFALWQRERLSGAELDRQLAYWRERLAGAPERLELPTDLPRPPVPTFRGAEVPVRLPAAALQSLRALAAEEGATLYMVALAAFQLLLARYSGTDDVVVGSPLAGRAQREVEGLIGVFLNTLVVRTDLSGDPSFRELLRRVRDGVLRDFEHQEIPFERLVAELRPDRSLSHAPIFQVLFQMDNARTNAPAAEAGEGELAGDSVQFDLALVLQTDAGGVGGALLYSTDLFHDATARRMVEHLARMMEQVGAHPDRRISRLELMTRAERERIVGWNRTMAKFPADRCIHQLFEEQAARTPGATAVAVGEESLSYAEVDARANRLARHLRRLGVGPEVRVGLCLERSLELMVAILGVMKAGGAYVPMDPGHPAERIGYMLADSGVAVLLTQDRLRAKFPDDGGMHVIAIDSAWDRISAESAEPVESGVSSENLCYVIYTSGSTGRPKGVAMHHRGVSNYIHWGIRFYGADRGHGAPVFTSMAVDLTITNLLPLFAGRTVRMLPEESPVEALARTIRERPEFGLIKITPIHLGLLNGMLEPEELAGAAHTLVIGADFLSAEPTVFWQEHAPGVRLMNEYGPTETVVGCSAYLLPTGRHRAGAVPVGRPIQNLTFYVLDRHLEPVPVGLPGELYIGGAGVARGYLGRPGLSGEKFVPDPFAEPGARMYRTGDRARWLADGNLMILGRTDNQVKIRGYRVELGEVEAVLRRRAAVRECMVAVREDRPGDRRLVAYVVADAADPAELRDWMRGILPEYMVPSAFVVMDALPQTPTGKIDRKALPAPEQAAPAVSETPRNEVEERLVELWEEVLEIDGIGPTQDFFELGGNSFLAMRLFTRANRALGCDLPVSTLFTGATIRHMADAVLEQKRAAEGAPAAVVPLQPGGSLPPLFLVHAGDRDVLGYVSLVRHLGADQPVYGVRDVGEDMARPVERIAREHVAAIRAVQPHGPYALAGWSFGGMVAFEMAIQLQRQGETVDFVGMFDAIAPHIVNEHVETDDELLVGLAQEAADEWGWEFSFPAEAVAGLGMEEKLARIHRALRAQGPVPEHFRPESLGEGFRSVRARIQSGSGYVPGRYHGTLTLYRASVPYAYRDALFAARTREEEHVLGWGPYVSGAIEVCFVPGSHVTLGSEPHVAVLAQRMRESLAAARARSAAFTR